MGGVGVGGVSGGGDSPDAGEPTLDPATGILSTPGQLKPPQQQQPQAPVSQRIMHVHDRAPSFYLFIGSPPNDQKMAVSFRFTSDT